MYYRIHARNDVMMRATPPILGPPDRIPPWAHALAVTAGTLVLVLETIIVIGFVILGQTGTIPKIAFAAALAWSIRGVLEIHYMHALMQNDVEPLRGSARIRYLVIGVPQAIVPFLVAERFYEGTGAYDFALGRFLAFIAVPVVLMVLDALLYRGRV